MLLPCILASVNDSCLKQLWQWCLLYGDFSTVSSTIISGMVLQESAVIIYIIRDYMTSYFILWVISITIIIYFVAQIFPKLAMGSPFKFRVLILNPCCKCLFSICTHVLQKGSVQSDVNRLSFTWITGCLYWLLNIILCPS